MAVIEVAEFALATDEESFAAADKRMQTGFAYQQPGCVRRTTARADDGRWLVLTLWADDAAADSAQAAEHHPVAADFWAHVAPDSVSRRRFTLLSG
jgi:hypothetical protein